MPVHLSRTVLPATYALPIINMKAPYPRREITALTHKRPFTLSISDNKDKSVAEDTQATEVVRVYSDGSVQDGKVGAAALLSRQGEPDRIVHYHLGSISQHTVHEAELVGILLGLHLIKADKKRQNKLRVGSRQPGSDKRAKLGNSYYRSSKQRRAPKSKGTQPDTPLPSDGQRATSE